MQSATRYVGLDVHKHEITACIIDHRGKKLNTRRFPLTRSRLTHFARSLQPTDHVALEATTNCWAVVGLLEPCVARVVVSNPMATKAIAQAKVKTDKVDAQVLAQLLRCDYLPAVWRPDPMTQQMRELSARRAALTQDRTAVRNRIHSVLATRLLAAPTGDLFSQKGLQWLCNLSEDDLDKQGRLMIAADLELHQAIDRQIDRLDEAIARHSWDNEQVKLLMTLPGVDMRIAHTLLAALGDIDRFPSPEHAASYLGLVPSVRQSAAKCYRGPITKQGNTRARWMLVQAAQHVGRHPGPLGHFFRRLKRRKNHNVAVVAVARKLVIIAVHMLKNNEPYRYAQPKTTETKLARLRIRATGEVRRGGSPKGTKATAKLAGGSRTIKSLDRIYREEALPPRQELSAGERRVVHQAGCTEFIHSLETEHVVPRKTKQPDRTKRTEDSVSDTGGPVPQTPRDLSLEAKSEAGRRRKRAP